MLKIMRLSLALVLTSILVLNAQALESSNKTDSQELSQGKISPNKYALRSHVRYQNILGGVKGLSQRSRIELIEHFPTLHTSWIDVKYQNPLAIELASPYESSGVSRKIFPTFQLSEIFGEGENPLVAIQVPPRGFFDQSHAIMRRAQAPVGLPKGGMSRAMRLMSSRGFSRGLLDSLSTKDVAVPSQGFENSLSAISRRPNRMFGAPSLRVALPQGGNFQTRGLVSRRPYNVPAEITPVEGESRQVPTLSPAPAAPLIAEQSRESAPDSKEKEQVASSEMKPIEREESLVPPPPMTEPTPVIAVPIDATFRDRSMGYFGQAVSSFWESRLIKSIRQLLPERPENPEIFMPYYSEFVTEEPTADHHGESESMDLSKLRDKINSYAAQVASSFWESKPIKCFRKHPKATIYFAGQGVLVVSASAYLLSEIFPSGKPAENPGPFVVNGTRFAYIGDHVVNHNVIPYHEPITPFEERSPFIWGEVDSHLSQLGYKGNKTQVHLVGHYLLESPENSERFATKFFLANCTEKFVDQTKGVCVYICEKISSRVFKLGVQ